MRMDEEIVNKIPAFKYLWTFVTEDGELDVEINHQIQCGWNSWRKLSGVLCDKKMNVTLKGKVYKTAVRPAMLYSSETWAVKKAQEKKMNVAEMRM